MSVNIIHGDCDPSAAKNKELPRNSYLVSYGVDGELQYDVVQCGSQFDIFNYYWDKYRDVRGIKWTEGIINPKTWNYQAPEKKKKR
jgi:hypothetical protein